jgi:two-component system, NarL family, response regulator DesR
MEMRTSMPSDTPSGNSRIDEDPSVPRDPAVGVVAPVPVARRLIAILERDGLDAAAIDLARRSRELDVLVVAVESPSGGNSQIGRVRDKHPSARLVLFTATATPAEARLLLVDDVAGLVLERDAESALALVVRATCVGQISYPLELMPTRLRTALSNREKQALGMVVMGFSNAEIATKLHVSESTVKSHLYSAFATIGVRTRKEAVALILDPNAGFGTGILAITGTGTDEDVGR